MASKKSKHSYEEILSKLMQFGPGSLGWADALSAMDEAQAARAMEEVFSRRADGERELIAGTSLLKNPKPGWLAFTRTLSVGLDRNSKVTNPQALVESPLLSVISSLAVGDHAVTSMVDFEALLSSPRFNGSPLRHLTLSFAGSAAHGEALARSPLAQQLQSICVSVPVLDGILGAGVDWPALRGLDAFNAPRLPALDGWAPFQRLTHLGGFSEAAGMSLPPNLSSLATNTSTFVALLPQLPRLEQLAIHGASHEPLDALAAREPLGLRSLTWVDYDAEEVAEYLVTSRETGLERLVLRRGRSRRCVFDALCQTALRPRELVLEPRGPVDADDPRHAESLSRFFDSPLLAGVRRLHAQTLTVGDASLDRLLPHLAHLDALTIATSNAAALERLRAAAAHTTLNASCRPVSPVDTAADPLYANPNLAHAVRELYRTSTHPDPGPVALTPALLGAQRQVWWDQETVTHDAHHTGTRVTYRPVVDLEGIEHLTGLHTLSLADNMVDSLEPVAGLPLAILRVPGNRRIRSVAALASSTLLKELDLARTRARDLGPLSSLTSLETVDLSETRVRDLSPLASLTQLKALNIAGTSVSDVNALASLTGLETLVITGGAEAKLPGLEALVARGVAVRAPGAASR